jgi:RNA polymerase sigma-70 factor (ECF subfamily)
MDNGASSYNRFLRGDNSGLEELVEMYNDGLILFINAYVNDLSASEDLAADTFLELIVKKCKFEESGKFKTWLFKIARNNAVDYLRKRKRHKSAEQLADTNAETADPDTPESLLLRSERDRQLHAAIAELNADYARVLHLLYFEEMSYEQAGRVLRKTTKQIKNLAYRARQSLKVGLEKEGFDYEVL